MKTPWKNCTTHLLFEPLDFVARLAALIPKPRINLIRYHGLFASHHTLRAQVTPARRGRASTTDAAIRTPAERHAAMTWAQRLKRVSDIDVETCEHCSGRVRTSPPSKTRWSSATSSTTSIGATTNQHIPPIHPVHQRWRPRQNLPLHRNRSRSQRRPARGRTESRSRSCQGS